MNDIPPEDDIVYNEETGQPVYDLLRIDADTQGTLLPTIGIIVEL